MRAYARSYNYNLSWLFFLNCTFWLTQIPLIGPKPQVGDSDSHLTDFLFYLRIFKDRLKILSGSNVKYHYNGENILENSFLVSSK